MDVVKFEYQDTKLFVSIDPNKNGVPVIKLELDLSEIPSEVWEAIKAKRG